VSELRGNVAAVDGDASAGIGTASGVRYGTAFAPGSGGRDTTPTALTHFGTAVADTGRTISLRR